MHAARRVSALERAGDALAFGRIVNTDGETLYIGRLSVIDDDVRDAEGEKTGESEVLLVDWRAPASAPFYRATPLEPHGVSRRRHLLYDETPGVVPELVGYSDEVFDLEYLHDPSSVHLRGEAALLASLEAPSDGQMRSVVSTIQAEQDAVVRAPASKALVVQGGPGTGKTVVALHRAAYLLYNQRSRLAESGVLIVGPTPEFLRYIAQVLPSLGETGVVSSIASQLFPGILRGHVDPVETASLKGSVAMADLLANAVAMRRRLPTKPLKVWFGTKRAEVSVGELAEAFRLAERHRHHNDGADAFGQGVVELLASKVEDPFFAKPGSSQSTFRRNRTVRHFLLRHWPLLSPEQALNDLLGSPALLRAAARGTGLDHDDLKALDRPRTPQAELGKRRWSDADVPLLDELWALLGGALGGQVDDRIRERDDASEFELAEAEDAATTNFDDDLDDLEEEEGDAEWAGPSDDEDFAAWRRAGFGFSDEESAERFARNATDPSHPASAGGLDRTTGTTGFADGGHG